MDIIDRKKLMEDAAYLISEAVETGKSEDYRYGLVAVMTLIEHADDVDAVPLDKLCEWLDYHAGKPLDCVGEQCIKCKFDVTDSGNGNCWKAMLTKWMEEQDANDHG